MSEKNEFELKRLDHIHQERIKYIEFNNQYTLIQHETHCECFRDSIKYSVELSKTALNGALILNGAGIIPIVYSKVEFLYPAAVHFAWGALWAVCSALVGYLYQSLITRTWRYYVPEPHPRKHVRRSWNILFLKKRWNIFYMLQLFLVFSLFCSLGEAFIQPQSILIK